MKRFVLFVFSLLVVASFSSCDNAVTTITLVETTDTHSRFDAMGNDMFYMRALQDSLRERLIILDGGDNFQGSTQMYLSNHDTTMPHLGAQFFNFLPYDAIVVGNHDIEAGRDVFDRAYSQTKAAVLGANIIDDNTGEPYFKPYTIIEREGYRIAILGLLTPYVTTWVPERLRQGIGFEPLEQSAEKWIDIIREKENPDVMVGLFHSGWDGIDEETELDHELGQENAVRWVAENVVGFDVIFYGHDHKAKAEVITNKEGQSVAVLNAGHRGHNIAKAEIKLKRGTRPVVTASLISTDGEISDPEWEAMTRVYDSIALNYQNTEVALLPLTINSDDTYQGPCLWVDEMHRAQFDIIANEGMTADISVAAPLSQHKTLNAGTLTIKDFFTWYPFENSLSLITMKGSEVREYLEYSFDNKKPIYNFDSGAGILYEVDPSQDKGKRVNITAMADGTAFDEERYYAVVMNSYRAMGGGGHLMRGLGWSKDTIRERTIWESDKDLRSLFIDWARAKKTLNNESLNCWKIK